jgi:gp32 DNA binding protein like
MENLNDIFNLSLDDFKEPEKSASGGRNIFKPDSKAGKDGVYKSVVRFLPWHKDVKKSIMKKWSSWLVNPATSEGKMIDCPSTIGQKSVLQDLYWKFKKSDSVAEQKLADNFSRRQRFASLVQIIKDDNNPENVGKIMVWPFGTKIYNKLQAEMKPEFGKPHIPFDLFEGKPFLVHVTTVAGFNNYDNCRFLDEKLPITIDGQQMQKNQEDLGKIKAFLETSPDLASYDYQEWDQATQDFVNGVIANTVPGGRMIANVESANRTAAPAKPSAIIEEPVVSSPKAESLPNLSADLGDLGNMDDFGNDSNFDDELYASL